MNNEANLVHQVFHHITFYFPVYLPILLTIFSVFSGLATQRIRLTIDDLLKVHGDVTLSLFSFIIWAFVTYSQHKRIDLNDQWTIDFNNVLILLFVNMLILIFGVLALRHDWDALPAFPRIIHKARWVNFVVLAVSICSVFLPIFLKEPSSNRTDSFRYTVVLPYMDSSIARNIGESRWADRLMCDFETVRAKTQDQAILAAQKEFESKGLMSPLIPSKSLRASPDLVRLLKEKAFAFETP